MGIFQKRRSIEKAAANVFYRKDDKLLQKELFKSVSPLKNATVKELTLNLTFEAMKTYVTKLKLSDYFNRFKTLLQAIILNYSFQELKGEKYAMVHTSLPPEESPLRFVFLFIFGDLINLEGQCVISLPNTINFFLSEKVIVPLIDLSFSQISSAFCQTITTVQEFDETRFSFNKNNLWLSHFVNRDIENLEGNNLKLRIQSYFKELSLLAKKEGEDLSKQFVLCPPVILNASFTEMFNCIGNENSNFNLLMKHFRSFPPVDRAIISFFIKVEDNNLLRVLYILLNNLAYIRTLVIIFVFEHESIFNFFKVRLKEDNYLALRMNYLRLKLIVGLGGMFQANEYSDNVLMSLLCLTFAKTRMRKLKDLRKGNTLRTVAKFLVNVK